MAVRYAAALLGAVTHAANHHQVPAQRLDGSWGTKTARDAQQRQTTGRKRPRPPSWPPVAPTPLVSPTVKQDDSQFEGDWTRAKRGCSAAAKAQAREKTDDAANTLRRVAEIGATAVVPESRLPASQRIGELHQRVRHALKLMAEPRGQNLEKKALTKASARLQSWAAHCVERT